jgi:hypothetical protein
VDEAHQAFDVVLHEEVVGPGRLLGQNGGEPHDRACGAVPTDEVGRFLTIPARHEEVEDHHVRVNVGREHGPLETVCGDASDPEAAVERDHGLEQLAHRRIVIDYQDHRSVSHQRTIIDLEAIYPKVPGAVGATQRNESG